MTAHHPDTTAPSPAVDAVPRVGARILLLDDEDRILLIEEAGTDPAGNWHHWLTPGGGVEDGESLPAAATRELFEETGVRVVLPPDAEPLYVQQRRWSWRGVTYDQTDHLFAARVSRAFEPEPAGLTAMEQETVLGARWWTAAELRATDQVLLTPVVADLLERVAADDSVERPRYRPAGRALVVDRDGFVLLIEIASGPDDAGTNWIAPGGGCEADEGPASAASRELQEETGLRADVGSADAVFVERAVFPFGGRLYDQVDHFFLVRVEDRPTIDDSGLNERERAMTVEYRWWSAEQLRASTAVYWPVGLPDLLDRIMAGDLPPAGAGEFDGSRP